MSALADSATSDDLKVLNRALQSLSAFAMESRGVVDVVRADGISCFWGFYEDGPEMLIRYFSEFVAAVQESGNLLPGDLEMQAAHGRGRLSLIGGDNRISLSVLGDVRRRLQQLTSEFGDYPVSITATPVSCFAATLPVALSAAGRGDVLVSMDHLVRK